MYLNDRQLTIDSHPESLSRLTPQHPLTFFRSIQWDNEARDGQIDIKQLINLCEEYNHFLSFAGRKNIAASAAFEPGKIFQRSAQEVGRLVQELQMKIAHGTQDLEDRLDSFILALAREQSASPKHSILYCEHFKQKVIIGLAC